MSTELREAIEACIQINDDGDGAPIGAVIQSVVTEFGIGPTLSRTLDLYQRGDLCSCGEGRIRKTPERNERLKTDGGRKAQVVDTPDDDPRTMPPDPKTAHPDFLLGRDVAIDFGSNVREGEIRQVKDHAVQGRWISAKPDQGAMILADPEEHDIEFVDGGQDD